MKNKVINLLCLVLALGALSAQTPPRALPVETPPTAPASAPEATSLARTHALALDHYTLNPGDQIKIVVFGEDDMTTETPISQNGEITVPLIGSVSVQGMTVEAAQNKIAQLLDAKYIINPRVTISVEQFSTLTVTVLGEVIHPGKITLPPDGGLDLLSAVALAGGFSPDADQKNVIVRRTVEGKQTIIKVNAKKLINDPKVKPFMLLPDDNITVALRFW